MCVSATNFLWFSYKATTFHSFFPIAWLADGDYLMCCIVTMGRQIAKMFSTFSLCGSLFLMRLFKCSSVLELWLSNNITWYLGWFALLPDMLSQLLVLEVVIWLLFIQNLKHNQTKRPHVDWVQLTQVQELSTQNLRGTVSAENIKDLIITLEIK